MHRTPSFPACSRKPIRAVSRCSSPSLPPRPSLFLPGRARRPARHGDAVRHGANDRWPARSIRRCAPSAAHLDTTAQGALEGSGRRRAAAQRPTRASCSRSAPSPAPRTTSATRWTAYEARPFEVPFEGRGARGRAQEIEEKIRAARTLESTYDEWEGIRDVLGRMTSLMAGQGSRGAHGLRLARAHRPRPRAVPAARSGPGDQRHPRPRTREEGGGPVRPRARSSWASSAISRPRAGTLHLPRRCRRRGPRRSGRSWIACSRRRAWPTAGCGMPRRSPRIWDDSGRTITILQRLTTLVRS